MTAPAEDVLELGDPVALNGLEIAPPVEIVADAKLTLATPVTIQDARLIVAEALVLPVLTYQADGQRVWVGEGTPDVVTGASPGDLYLDAVTGVLFRLI